MVRMNLKMAFRYSELLFYISPIHGFNEIVGTRRHFGRGVHDQENATDSKRHGSVREHLSISWAFAFLMVLLISGSTVTLEPVHQLGSSPQCMCEAYPGHGFRGGRVEFVVFAQSSRPFHPSEASLHDPTFGPNLEGV